MGSNPPRLGTYPYLLLEFQSSDDYFMANRVMTNLGLLYQDIIRSQALKKGDLLPPVLPIVIYNGASHWSGPVEIASLINPIHSALQAYTPQLSYFLLQEKATPKDYSQAHPNNLVGHLIALEQCATPDELQTHIQLLQQQLAAAHYQPIRRSFAIWLSRLLRVKFKSESIPEYQELTEVNAMLAERLTDWTLQWKKEGEEIGKKKEALRLLSKQACLKYGELPDWALQKMEQADRPSTTRKLG